MSSSTGSVAMLIPIIMGLLFLILGGTFVFLGLRSRSRAQAAQQWPAARGKILSTELRRHTQHDTEGSRTTFEPAIEYEYEVVGTPYRSTSVAFGATSYGRGQAEEILSRFPVGTETNVYYNPEKPNEAVLIRESKGMVLFLVIGIIFLLVGLAMCCVGAGLVAALVSMTTGS